MAKTIQTIQALILAKLSALEVDIAHNPLFKIVTDKCIGTFTGYPAAVVTPTGGNGKVEDTAVNERVLSFNILLYQEQSEQATDKTDATLKMTEICDAVMKAFDIDPTLGREVAKVEVVDFAFDFKAQTGTWNFATFKINAVILVSHY
jgi:hypothetical protein